MQRGTETTSRPYYPFFDGWRGIAILWVLLAHMVFHYKFSVQGLYYFAKIVPFALDIFFVISGYLMVGVLLRGENGVSFKGFFVKRVSRILPQYFVMLTAIFLLNFIIPSFSISVTKQVEGRVLDAKEYYQQSPEKEFVKIVEYTVEKDSELTKVIKIHRPIEKVIKEVSHADNILLDTSHEIKKGEWINEKTLTIAKFKKSRASCLPYLLFIQNYFDYFESVPLLMPTWFIAAIIHFYIIIAMIVFMSYRLMPKYNPQGRRVFVFISCLLLLFLAILMKSMKGLTSSDFFYTMTHLRMDSFLFGCLLWFAKDIISADKRLLGKRGTTALFAIGLAVFIFSVVIYDARVKPGLFTASYIAFGLMIAGTFRKTALSTVFENRHLRWLGRHSYGIYIWHYPVFYYFSILQNYININESVSFSFGILIAVLFGAGMEKLFAGVAKGINEKLGWVQQ